MLGQLLVNGLVVGSGYALIAIGHTLIFGLMKIINFAHGEFFMLGAFLAYTFATVYNGFGIGYAGAMIASVIVVSLLGYLLDKGVFKRIRKEDESVSVLVTIGLSIFIMNGARLIWGAAPRNITNLIQGGVSLGNTTISYTKLIIVFLTILIIAVLHFFIQKTTTGKAFRATFQNRDAALLAGIEVESIYTLNMTLGCALAGISGALLSMIFVLEPTMGVKAIGVAWIVVCTGSPGSVLGAIVVGYLLGVSESLGGAYISSQYKNAIGFIVLVFVLLIKPQGLFGKKLSRMGG
ncbi:MAG: branched-chain amino acid ABC transporter permease [Dehalobacterium sp.]